MLGVIEVKVVWISNKISGPVSTIFIVDLCLFKDPMI